MPLTEQKIQLTPTQAALARFYSMNSGFLNSAKDFLGNQYDLFWNHTDLYSAQDLFDSIGISSAQALEALQIITQLIQLVEPEYIPTPMPNAITPNPDGTVTVVPNS